MGVKQMIRLTPMFVVNGLKCSNRFYGMGVSSTLLFRARPSAVSLVATGREKPKPLAVNRL